MLKEFILRSSVIIIIISVSLLSFPLSGISAAATCSLGFTVTPDKTTIQPGDTVTYSINLKNTSKVPCKGVSYSVYYGVNETFVSSVPDATAKGYYWYVGGLGSGKEFNTTIVTKHNPSLPNNNINNQACATANNARDVCDRTVVSVSATLPPPAEATTTIPVTDPAPSIPPPPPVTNTVLPKESGVWIWDTPVGQSASYFDSRLTLASQNGFNVVYITVDDYLDIYSMADGPAKDAQKTAYFSALSHIVEKAKSLGMSVDAEGGARDWVLPENRWKGYALIDFVTEYNSKNPNTALRGFQYDVEPYLLSTYETNKADVLTDYVEFIDASAERMKNNSALFSIVIPHFYDDTQAWTPAITYNGKTAYTFNHLLDILEKKPNSGIIVMAYRNFFSGANGTEEISKVEVEEASAGSFHSRVIVAQETGNVDPSFVTFYGMSKDTLFSNLASISSAFTQYSNYGGTAVHYLDPFLNMQ